MGQMTWQIGVFVAFRVLCALPALRWPFAGGLFAIITDFSDLFLMNAIGGIDDYQRLDKLCDLAYMLVFLKVAFGWAGLERGVAVGLFAFRMIGEVVFELSGARWTLLVFPNVFEFWFIAVAALHHYRPGMALSRRDAAVKERDESVGYGQTSLRAANPEDVLRRQIDPQEARGDAAEGNDPPAVEGRLHRDVSVALVAAGA